MKGTISAPVCEGSAVAVAAPRALCLARLADYFELSKPKIAALALVTVAVGYFLATTGTWNPVPLWHAVVGISLVAAGSSAFNQYLERLADGRMQRTCNRPLPAGRLMPGEVLLFGIICGLAGTLYLACTVNWLTSGLAAMTLLLYSFVYTPLKSKTYLNTVIGAIPGALPPVLGWTAAGGKLDEGAFTLFAVLFLWQFPHFMAIAWIYREDYARAGMRMLSVHRSAHVAVGALAVSYALVLLPVSLLPSQFGMAGTAYFVAALVLGVAYLASSIAFLLRQTTSTARRLLWTSLVYLPALLLALVLDHYLLLA
jgi:protoheme IX farnesyltransferase